MLLPTEGFKASERIFLLGLCLLLLVDISVHAGCLTDDNTVPVGTQRMCPVVPNETDITHLCTLDGHKAHSGGGVVSCQFHAETYEWCPGVYCRINWSVNRTADGSFQVHLRPTHMPHCSVYDYNQLHVESEDCDDLFKPSKCVDVKKVTDGRPYFNQAVQHSCTCFGHNCTLNLTGSVAVNEAVNKDNTLTKVIPVIAVLVPVLGIAIGIVLTLLIRRWRVRQRSGMKASELDDKEDLITFGVPYEIKVDHSIARGKFGMVYHALGGDQQDLAVKVTNEKNKDSWLNECNLIFNSFMRHASIVKFHFGEERITATGCRELWLVMELCPAGSLYHYLKGTKLSWNECVDLMSSLANGVDYLHSYVSYKPEVAHRDLKSTNVLIKLQPQPRCVIADFGLAVTLQPDMDMASLQHQAGTPRYMAPECLASSVNFQDTSSFLKADIYALGLLLWEISAPCVDFNCSYGPTHYALPYWKYVGDIPSVRIMHDVVINQRMRPELPKGWQGLVGTVSDLRILSSLLCDAWDCDYDARLTAASIKSRIAGLKERKVETEAAIKAAIPNITLPTTVGSLPVSLPPGSTKLKGSYCAETTPLDEPTDEITDDGLEPQVMTMPGGKMVEPSVPSMSYTDYSESEYPSVTSNHHGAAGHCRGKVHSVSGYGGSD